MKAFGEDDEGAENFDAAAYWDRRLAANYSLRGTGHISYSSRYNDWLYRRKGDVLSAALGPGEPGPGSRALDLGSGTGWCVDRLIKHRYVVDASDLAPTAVSRLGQKFPGLRVFRLELGEAPIPQRHATYRVVTAMDVLYHLVSDDSFAFALAEVARVLEPGGRLIATDALGKEEGRPAEHVRFRNFATWSAIAGNVGLRVGSLLPLYQWLSRDRHESRGVRLPDGIRGPLEYGLERAWGHNPHMRCVTLLKP